MIERASEILHILYSGIPPERVWRFILEDLLGQSGTLPDQERLKKTQEDIFLRFAQGQMPSLNGDTMRLLYNRLRMLLEEDAAACGTCPMPFTLLRQVGEEMLMLRGEEPYCQRHKALQWREMYHFLSQDSIVCAYLASVDLKRSVVRKKFTWPAVLWTNYEDLNALLRKGLAENHYHINGSTQSMAISWCYAMNYPQQTRDILRKEEQKMGGLFSGRLRPSASYGSDDNMGLMSERVLLAALIRSVLFQCLHMRPHEKDKVADLIEQFRHSLDQVIPLKQSVNVLRHLYGAEFLQGSKLVRLDYAMEKEMELSNADGAYRLLAGERHFLYRCFQNYFSGSFTVLESYLLYLYLILKTDFRLEFIQGNHVYGFDNFSRYEQRKSTIWDNTGYFPEAIRMSVYAPLYLEAAQKLEGRFCPAASVRKNIEKVQEYDLAEYEAENSMLFSSPPDEKLPKDSCKRNPEQLLKLPYFYVLHFPKQADDAPAGDRLNSGPRHQKYRRSLRNWSEVLVETLRTSAYFCSRIRGIDACSNELVCRPEVFGTAYRFLRKSSCYYSGYHDGLRQPPRWFLSASYHAGEDFYDITDGLRAIDEAVNFLELTAGDRLGHALAMGIDPEKHYGTQDNQVTLTKQIYLDNLVWLLYRSVELHVQIDPSFRDELLREAISVFRSIYCEQTDPQFIRLMDETVSAALVDYYHSMKLRGDLPELYRTGVFKKPAALVTSYEFFAERTNDRNLTSYRQDRRAVCLYYLYQYSGSVRQRGGETVSFEVSRKYAQLVERMQDALQEMTQELGLTVEANPSSNVSISSLERYEDHPIFRWYQHGLHPVPGQKPCPQLAVCINTDDLGVFDTSLQFEYALIFEALSQKRDADEKRIYQDCEILDYIENLRERGFQSIFPAYTQVY